MYYYLVTIYLVIIFITTSLTFLPIAVVLRVFTGWFDRKLKILHVFSCFWASCYIWLSPLWRVTITGRENVEKNKAYVMISNHQSMLDILVVYYSFLHFKWVAKASLFKAPIIGWNMYLNRYIKIERSSLKSQRKMIRQCGENIMKGNSVMIFPEGTRSKTGELKRFKEGAFLIALQQKSDIIPMVIDGSSEALPESGFFFRTKKHIKLHILPAIMYESYKDMNADQLSIHTYQIVEKELNSMRES
ncbi:MAG: 1-acyl-sn-glycerol-3-phosphate acyltransferase [Bacteroidales bacterium]|jgi:1-acyl-sn-glycerol-3-phosphate acyltransferase|nr:1-acyl-sn-glycerol-3-phosphate acyltransferase [Bacteroidales bacterium]